MSKIKKISVGRYGLVIALVVVVIFFGIASQGRLFNAMNISNIFMQNTYLIILSTAMFFCLSTGCVDLSVGAFVLYAGAIFGTMVVTHKWPVLPSLLVLFASSFVIGICQGFSIAYLNVPPFIATLGFELIIKGLAISISGGQTLGPFPASIRYLGGAFLPNDFRIFGLDGICLILFIVFLVSLIVSEIVNRNKKLSYGYHIASWKYSLLKVLFLSLVVGFILLRFSQYNGMPFPLVIIIVIVLIYSYISTATVFGRHVFAVGSNRLASRLSGVDDRKTIMMVFINSAILSTFAGLIVAGRLNAATMSAGDGNELEAIASVTIGGGSRGGIFGAFCGAAIMAVVINGMNVLGLAVDVQKIVKGLILLLAVMFDVATKKSE